MENALLIGLSRQVALGRELDVIANNMANVTTNGFKARTRAFANTSCRWRARNAFPRPDQPAVLRDRCRHAARLRSGARSSTTGNPLDVAIKGDAFFAVQTRGRRALHPQRRPRDRRAGPARHQRRPHRPRRQSGPITFGPEESGFEHRAGRHGHARTRASAGASASCASTTRRPQQRGREPLLGAEPAAAGRRTSRARAAAPSSARTSSRCSR